MTNAGSAPRVVLHMGISVDGFVAGPHGELDWIFESWDDELTAWEVETLWQAGVHAMGRATYLDMAAVWPSSTEPFAAPMNEVPKAVFSKTLTETPWSETRVLRGDLAEEVEGLETEPGKVVLAHGGASFARALAASGLVDEYRLRVHPVALGSGLPVFSGLTGRLRLALVDARTFPNGVAVHTYRPV
jgi:dihydrofolate reductase